MHKPNPISLAAKASGEPEFREVGVGPWTQEHPGEPRPDDPKSPNYDRRYDTTLLDEGDRRNVLDRYRYWTVNAIRDDLDAAGRHGFEVAIENWTHDFNIGSMVRTANAFTANRVHIVGPHKWNRKGSLMTELYQHVEYHPSIDELVTCWKLRIAGEIAAPRHRLPPRRCTRIRLTPMRVRFSRTMTNPTGPPDSRPQRIIRAMMRSRGPTLASGRWNRPASSHWISFPVPYRWKPTVFRNGV